ncbi:hypothetical protein JOC78_001525 [Bacillus ectoiniformans]|uniref:SCP2 sterol-binding domain-containing protein n=1 Tax=Bacillus ectoiniformans TaxID=1494429 RepID=UPI00195B05DA|nr:SCP2 sterol-binding domain-containing protein [Bacillus ectoiniformans]MBM7648579.1 hypothetical protein [Bacillus ectoiniformans]
MNDCLQLLQEACRDRAHIKGFLPAEAVTIQLETVEGCWLLSISQQGMSCEESQSSSPDLRIIGSLETISSWLTGRERLQTHLKLGSLKAVGFYRVQLWFESYVWLCRPYEQKHAVNI